MSVMALATHDDRSLRKIVVFAVRGALKDSNSRGHGMHPAAELLAQEVLNRLRSCEEPEPSTTVIPLLSLLDGIMDVLPQNAFDRLTDCVMKLYADSTNPSVCLNNFRDLLMISVRWHFLFSCTLKSGWIYALSVVFNTNFGVFVPKIVTTNK